MIAAVAGTFNVLHDGHKALLDRAFSLGDTVYIGITSDTMAASSRSSVNTFYLRKTAVEAYAVSKNHPFRIFPIDDVFGPDEMMDAADVLVVSEETLDNGKKVAERSASRGKRLELSVVSIVKKDDGTKISSTDIIKGVCSRSGNTKAIEIGVGSCNPVKVEAVRTVMERIYGDVRIFAVDAKSNVPDQPFGPQTNEGAKNRAKGALGTHDLGVGIEAGVFEILNGLYDIQHCAIIDQKGQFTFGSGSGFKYPEKVAECVRGGMTVGDSMKKIYGETDIGKQQGAIGFLSNGLLDRKRLTEQSVLAAMLPRIYGEVE